jgi:hypothetical protein
MRSISLPAIAIACALVLSPGATSAEPLDNPKDAPTWLQFRTAFAAEDFWPDLTNPGSHSVKSKARAVSVLDNLPSLDKQKANASGHPVQLASKQPLPESKTRQTFAAVN